MRESEMGVQNRVHFCRQLNEHQFKPIDRGLMCIHCGLFQPYPEPVRRPARPAPRPNARLVYSSTGTEQCAYCRHPFHKMRPPTRDHVKPVSRGGMARDGIVIVCQTCNSARGNADYDEYLAAVEQEHQTAKREKREYRRPKHRPAPDGTWHITTLSTRDWNAHWKRQAK